MVPSGKMPDPVNTKNEPAAPGGRKGPVTLDEMEQMLDELAEELPEAFFYGLNRGVVLLSQTERHPRGQGGLYTLGCYFSGGEMGVISRFITARFCVSSRARRGKDPQGAA